MFHIVFQVTCVSNLISLSRSIERCRNRDVRSTARRNATRTRNENESGTGVQHAERTSAKVSAAAWRQKQCPSVFSDPVSTGFPWTFAKNPLRSLSHLLLEPLSTFTNWENSVRRKVEKLKKLFKTRVLCWVQWKKGKFEKFQRRKLYFVQVRLSLSIINRCWTYENGNSSTLLQVLRYSL